MLTVQICLVDELSNIFMYVYLYVRIFFIKSSKNFLTLYSYLSASKKITAKIMIVNFNFLRDSRIVKNDRVLG